LRANRYRSSASTRINKQEESNMPHKTQYAVGFLGYSATVIARGKNGPDVDYAMLDFVRGGVCMIADGGWVMVSNRSDLEPFLKDLPKLANEIQDRLRKGRGEFSQQSAGLPEPWDRLGALQAMLRPSAEDMFTLSWGQNKITVASSTKITKFIRQVTQRFNEVQQLLEQAEEMGLQIKRRPYAEYIDEVAETGLARVEVFGFAFFVDGKLILKPGSKILFVRPVGTRGDTFEVHPSNPTSKMDPQSIH
jgi:hypothetical protein